MTSLVRTMYKTELFDIHYSGSYIILVKNPGGILQLSSANSDKLSDELTLALKKFNGDTISLDSRVDWLCDKYFRMQNGTDFRNN